MLVRCPACESKALIMSRENITKEFIKLNCACKSDECGHRFIMNLAFSHTVQPPLNSLNKYLLSAAAAMINSLPDRDKQQAKQCLLNL